MFRPFHPVGSTSSTLRASHLETDKEARRGSRSSSAEPQRVYRVRDIFARPVPPARSTARPIFAPSTKSLEKPTSSLNTPGGHSPSSKRDDLGSIRKRGEPNPSRSWNWSRVRPTNRLSEFETFGMVPVYSTGDDSYRFAWVNRVLGA